MQVARDKDEDFGEEDNPTLDAIKELGETQNRRLQALQDHMDSSIRKLKEQVGELTRGFEEMSGAMRP